VTGRQHTLAGCARDCAPGVGQRGCDPAL